MTNLIERLRQEAIQQADDEWASLVDEAADHIERLTAALTLACRDGWSDAQAAMEHYLTTANDWLLDPPIGARPEEHDGSLCHDTKARVFFHGDGECPTLAARPKDGTDG